MAAPQQATPAPNAATAEQKPDLLAGIVDATVSREMQQLKYDATVSEYYAASGYFGDTKPQSVVKLMIGRDLGLSPTAALMGIHIGKSGRPSLSGALIGALLKRGGYDWKFITHTDTECSAGFYKDGKPMTDELGKRVTVSWSYDHAKRAMLVKQTKDGDPGMYEKYGADMLYNRMIVRFQRRLAPEVTAGFVIYTPDELEEIEAKDVDDATTKKFGPDFRDKLERRGQEPATTGQENPAPEAALNDPPDTSERMAQSEPPAPPAIATGRPTMPEVRSQRTLSMPVRKI